MSFVNGAPGLREDAEHVRGIGSQSVTIFEGDRWLWGIRSDPTPDLGARSIPNGIPIILQTLGTQLSIIFVLASRDAIKNLLHNNARRGSNEASSECARESLEQRRAADLGKDGKKLSMILRPILPRQRIQGVPGSNKTSTSKVLNQPTSDVGVHSSFDSIDRRLVLMEALAFVQSLELWGGEDRPRDPLRSLSGISSLICSR